MITLQDVSKSFDSGQTFAVLNLSLAVERGEMLVLLGSSGSGKTTTLKMINRLIEPTSGTITVDGKDTRTMDLLALRRSMGYVFQRIGLFPHMTVEENVTLVPRLLGWPRKQRKSIAENLLDLVGLEPADYRHRYPRQLSGGQQQRVGVARALAADPPILLMDEPLGALDAVTRDTLQGEILRLRQVLDKTIVLVTHDIEEALRLGDRIAVLHEGRLDQVGTGAEIVARPATQFVADLFARLRNAPDARPGVAR